MDVQASRLPVCKKALNYAFELHAINGFDLEQPMRASRRSQRLRLRHVICMRPVFSPRRPNS